MLIDLLIVILISILYYLLCSRSRIINLVVGMLLIFIFCWVAGINIEFETEVSEVEFIIAVIFINIWITIHNHQLVAVHSHSRMNRFHVQHHNSHIYDVRDRLNNFRVEDIKDSFIATPSVYIKMVTHQIKQIDDYIDRHSKYRQLSPLINSLKELPVKINDIDFYLELPMQINYPRGLRRLVNQYRKVISEYRSEKAALERDKSIVNLFYHDKVSTDQTHAYLYVNLKFPYQRLVHDRIRRQVDLLVINPRGVFVFILLNCKSNQLNVSQDDILDTEDLTNKATDTYHAALDLKKLVNVDLDIVNYLIPDRFSLTPHVGVICTNPHVKIKLRDPHFEIMHPQELKDELNRIKPVLNKSQINQLDQGFKRCLVGRSKYDWKVFTPTVKNTVKNLLWYQDQIDQLSRKLRN